MSSSGVRSALFTDPRFYTSAKSINVSPHGSDNNDGLAVGTPVATIAHAASLLPSGGNIYLQPGNYQLAAPITLSGTTDLTIEGAGANTTSLITNGDFDIFEVTGVTARLRLANMWLGSFMARTSGYGVKITGTSGTHANNITLENLSIQNTAAGAYAQYSDSMIWDRVRYTQSIAGAAIAGSIFTVISSATAWLSRGNVLSTNGTLLADGLTLDSDTDTMMLREWGISFANRGLVLQNTIGGSSSGPRLVRLNAIYNESSVNAGFLITDGRDVRGEGCHAAVNGADGYTISGGHSIRLVDSVALQNKQSGYTISGASLSDTRLADCDASNNGTQAAGTYSGLAIGANTSHVRITGGRFADYVFPTTPSQQYGISIAATTDYVIAALNDLEGNMTGTINNLSTGTHNSIGPNL